MSCVSRHTAQKNKISIKDFFSKFDLNSLNIYWRNPWSKTSFFCSVNVRELKFSNNLAFIHSTSSRIFKNISNSWDPGGSTLKD